MNLHEIFNIQNNKKYISRNIKFEMKIKQNFIHKKDLNLQNKIDSNPLSVDL